MKIEDSIFIRRSAGTIWKFLENPENMLLWNPKVKRVSPSSFDTPIQGYCYAITYQMRERAKALEFSAEFVHFESPIKLIIRLTGPSSPRAMVIEEMYQLAEQDGGTVLTQVIQIGNSGINVFFRFLIWIIQQFGKPVGKRYLETLRDIVERE
jgi:hypothetical protein